MAEKTPVEQLTYKLASQELELIIRSLESGDMELEESLESYTRGVELLKSLRTRLADAEQKVSVLLKDVDGNDVLAVNEAAERAIARARAGEGPTILELKTYRRGGHSRNDACGYRPKDEENYWLNDRDPVKLFREKLFAENVTTEEELAAMEAEVENEIEDCVEYAQKAPFPTLESALEDVYCEGGNN